MSSPARVPLAPERPPGAAPRALAPDLARGVMLLAIAFAHAPLFVLDPEHGSTLANRIADAFQLLFVTNHARPMFAFLFGYGMVQLLHRQAERGQDPVAVRRLVRRRGWWLIVIGVLHAVVLIPLDILAAYGLAAVVLAGLLRRKDATLLWVAGVSFLGATALVGAAMGYVFTVDMPSMQVPLGATPWELVGDRLTGLPYGIVIGTIMVIPGVVIGMWAGRRRVLDEPERHRRFLTRAAVITTVVSVAGAIPLVLIGTGLWTPSGATQWLAAFAQPLTGYPGGIGMAAIIALVAIRVGRRPGRLTTAVTALGQRSMSLYLFQSVAFMAVFAPYGLGLQDDLGTAGALGVAAVTWLVSLALAEAMRRAGYRGPAEVLLRRLSYRRSSAR
ncbi:DUF418 domain-containing protein [Nonomuraea sp. NPDC050328]|uniref:DUF418 domain-containing protein n=1 Tax=Nonomuraea sp. NPDC050328 TaxID=3364361 RepID=UPI0037A85D7B